MTENSKNTSARAAKQPAAGKKTAVTKQTAAAKKTAPGITLKAGTSATPKPRSPKPRSPKPRSPKPRSPKPRSPKQPATAKATPTAPRTLPFPEDIAIRAYHLFLQRCAHGLQGSDEGDWLEAERQIALESVS